MGCCEIETSKHVGQTMRAIFVCLLLVFISISCFSEIDKPHDLIERNKMKAIVSDIYYQRALKAAQFQVDSISFQELNRAILQKHEVSLQQFENSMHYYTIKESGYDLFLSEIKDSIQQLVPVPTNPQNPQGPIQQPIPTDLQ